jgi:hypothetical protein
MKNVVIILSMLIFVYETNAQINLTNVFSTGVNNSGDVLSSGQTDLHWTITSSPIGATSALAASPEHDWTANTSSSGWINATGVGETEDIEPAGIYIYTLTFSLSGFNPSTATISGEWASDNASEIFLNGVDTGFSNPADEFGALDSFSLTNDFVSGENELQFYVTQDSGDGINPEGLQVNILSATAEPVPEPSIFSLLCLSALIIPCIWKVRQNSLCS